ncbi:MAG: pyruvate formate lyase family protein [Eubacteriales bacterium]
MTDRIQRMRDALLRGDHKVHRRSVSPAVSEFFRRPGDSMLCRAGKRLICRLNAEVPIVDPDARIVFQRTTANFPDLCSDEELAILRESHFLHERGTVSNICPDYGKIIASGLSGVLSELDGKEGELFTVQKGEITALLSLCECYRQRAEEVGNTYVADILSRIPYHGAKSFGEALQFFRILHFTVWAEGEYHVIVGRLDQFLYPYLAADLSAGRLTRDSALELLEEFFLSFNLDSDLYPGMQQGDDGQSVMLGGYDENGQDCYNLLSELCMTACGELCLADPKINLRVSGKTPDERYLTATELTKKGLGFPQYSNDDVVIPGLLALGYDPKDAYNYVVAACWEFIIPGYGMEIPNIAALSFPKAVNAALPFLPDCADFDAFYTRVKEEVRKEIARLTAGVSNLFILPAPFLSIMEEGCPETGRDVSKGNRYNSYGIHGVGLSTAVDSLAAIRHFVFETGEISASRMLTMVTADFRGFEGDQALLRSSPLKMGNNIDEVDRFACELLALFADTLEPLRNERGGRFRAGTGSAMFYLHKDEHFATPDGKNAAEPYGTNYSPGLYVRNKGPFSVIASFTKPDLTRTINGGPLTMEFHANSFLTKDGMKSVAMLVKCFVERGGHQLQLNAVDAEVLKDAQKHPENYRSLIVRVWGWSAYFVELDREYQEQIIRRQEFAP